MELEDVINVKTLSPFTDCVNQRKKRRRKQKILIAYSKLDLLLSFCHQLSLSLPSEDKKKKLLARAGCAYITYNRAWSSVMVT